MGDEVVERTQAVSAARTRVDGLARPESLAGQLEVLRADSTVNEAVLRCALPAREPAETEDIFAPVGYAVGWLQLDRNGSARWASTVLNAGSDRGGRVVAVDVKQRKLEVAGSVTRRRIEATVLLHLDDAPQEPLILAEIFGADERVTDRAETIRNALRAWVGEIESEAEDLPPGDGEPHAAPSDRYAGQLEGDGYVVRDYQQAGPLGEVRGHYLLSTLLFGAAAAGWFVVIQEALTNGFSSAVVGYACVAVVVTLAAYAFFGVARFASKYRGASQPLIRIMPDRFVVAPWRGRDGSVDTRPEGRFGAAVPIAEVRSVAVHPRGAQFGVEVDTDHGPMDVTLFDDESEAAFWAGVIEKRLESYADPKRRRRDEVAQEAA